MVGYGELEFELLCCIAYVLGNDVSQAAKVLFRTRGEEARIRVADAFIRKHAKKHGLAEKYSETIGDVSFCRRTRNV